MLRVRSVVALALGVLLACAGVAHAASLTLDGVRDEAYGNPSSTVPTNPNPGSNGPGTFWASIQGLSFAPPAPSATAGYNVYMAYSDDDDRIYVLIEFLNANERFSHGHRTGLWVDLVSGNGFVPDVYFSTLPLAEGYEGLQEDIIGVSLGSDGIVPFPGGGFAQAYFKDNKLEMAFASEGLFIILANFLGFLLPINDNCRITLAMVQAQAASSEESPSTICGPNPFNADGLAELEFNTVPTCALPEFDGGEPNDGDLGFPPTSTKTGFPTSTKTGFDGFPTSTKTGAGSTMKRSRTRVAKVVVNEEACPDGGEEGASCEVVMSCPYGFGFDHTAQSTKTVTMYCVPSGDETEELSYQFMDATEDQLRTCDFLGVPRKQHPRSTKFATKGTLPAP